MGKAWVFVWKPPLGDKVDPVGDRWSGGELHLVLLIICRGILRPWKIMWLMMVHCSLFNAQCSMSKSSTFLNKYPQTLSYQHNSVVFALTKLPQSAPNENLLRYLMLLFPVPSCTDFLVVGRVLKMFGDLQALFRMHPLRVRVVRMSDKTKVLEWSKYSHHHFSSSWYSLL